MDSKNNGNEHSPTQEIQKHRTIIQLQQPGTTTFTYTFGWGSPTTSVPMSSLIETDEEPALEVLQCLIQ